MAEEQPVKPANILNIVATNQGKRPLTQERPRAKALSVADVERLMGEGHALVDARSSAEFGAGHIPGAFNVQMSSSEFEQRIGWVVEDNTPIILLTNSADDAQRAIYNMAFVALDSMVSGYLDGGIDAWMDAGKAVRTVPQMDVFTLKKKLSQNGLQVLDVRDEEEWDEGHIEGAEHMPYTHMARQLDIPSQLPNLTLDKAHGVAVTCATGKRSSTAISMLLQNGYEDVYNVTGGMEAWRHAGFNMLDGSGCVVCETP